MNDDDRSRSASRRAFCAAALIFGAGLARAVPNTSVPIRIGTTSVILDNQVGFLHAWRDYLQPRLGRPITFLQRGSYREITSMLLGDELDFAWVCGYPYVRNRASWELVALPNYGGKPLYRSYLIVSANDKSAQGFDALVGKVFAYSDPDSNSGFLVPQFEMLRVGIYPPAHFRKSFFTYAHHKVVAAVADGVAQGGAVDGYVWETLALRAPELTRRTRVAHVSDEYGFPPMVARRSLDRATYELFRDTLLAMPQDARGRDLLHQLNLDGFLPPDDAQFAGIARVLDFVASRERLPT
jgi:phosphate/phosphite/phosphonate ABC transporter binding protein